MNFEMQLAGPLRWVTAAHLCGHRLSELVAQPIQQPVEMVLGDVDGFRVAVETGHP